MASLLIRSLSEDQKSRLRVQAAKKGRSMTEEAASLIVKGLENENPAPNRNWADEMFAQLDAIGKTDFELPPRNYGMREPPDFSRPEFDT